jgi:hypothetical protein
MKCVAFCNLNVRHYYESHVSRTIPVTPNLNFASGYINTKDETEEEFSIKIKQSKGDVAI